MHERTQRRVERNQPETKNRNTSNYYHVRFESARNDISNQGGGDLSVYFSDWVGTDKGWITGYEAQQRIQRYFENGIPGILGEWWVTGTGFLFCLRVLPISPIFPPSNELPIKFSSSSVIDSSRNSSSLLTFDPALLR